LCCEESGDCRIKGLRCGLLDLGTGWTEHRSAKEMCCGFCIPVCKLDRPDPFLRPNEILRLISGHGELLRRSWYRCPGITGFSGIRLKGMC
jgi:hypothetical protein